MAAMLHPAPSSIGGAAVPLRVNVADKFGAMLAKGEVEPTIRHAYT